MKDETRQGETDKTGQCRSLMKQRSICIGYPLSRAPILVSLHHNQLNAVIDRIMDPMNSVLKMIEMSNAPI
jgi:hypothetical protein